MTLFNWYSKLNEFLSPSIVFVGGKWYTDSNVPQSAGSQSLLQKQLLDALNQNNAFKLDQSTNQAARYTPNSFIAEQLGQLPMQLSPSMQQAFQSKLQGYGMNPQPFNPALVSQQQGSIIPTPTTNTPSPINAAPAPRKGGK